MLSVKVCFLRTIWGIFDVDERVFSEAAGNVWHDNTCNAALGTPHCDYQAKSDKIYLFHIWNTFTMNTIMVQSKFWKPTNQQSHYQPFHDWIKISSWRLYRWGKLKEKHSTKWLLDISLCAIDQTKPIADRQGNLQTIKISKYTESILFLWRPFNWPFSDDLLLFYSIGWTEMGGRHCLVYWIYSLHPVY